MSNRIQIVGSVLLLISSMFSSPSTHAQPVHLAPTWELELNFEAHYRYHASADLVSYEHADSLVFLDVWTGAFVTRRLKQGEFCFVDSTRSAITWIDFSQGLQISHTVFSSDSVLVSTRLSTGEFKAYGWKANSSSRTNRAFISGWGDNYLDAEDQGLVVSGPIGSVGGQWEDLRSANTDNPKISRSGWLSGGIDVGQVPTLGAPTRKWDQILFSGPGGYRTIRIASQAFAWLDDLHDVLITSVGLHSLRRRSQPFTSDTVRFLRALPSGWFWHAPFADWTYALGCKSDSSKVSIVSLVTDSAVAECLPTSRHIDTIYSDVQRNYVITYDAQARVLSGFIVDTTLIPSQVISGVEDDRHRDVVGQGAQSNGLVWPNPAREVAHLGVPIGTTHITITSVLGVTYDFAVLPGTEVVDIPLLDFANGVYIVNIDGTSTRQLLHVQR